ncbi:hypothetical protein [Arenivirga flava]|uniref:Uncharacterized protein n=1 Tax=Arenivirga flava TaxID=1930060 RepID=A0AA37UNA6_9MICO|nr:hypothetical protein [Arenivirga flava]GMA28041.1 hypothetical protein GCM10025874_12940 [Arenivirga flava]
MTLHDASAGPIAATARETITQPSLGRVPAAAIIPLSLSLYEIVLNDRPIGYIEAAGPIWVALSGTPYAFAVEVGQHRNLTAAVRILTH